MDGELHSNDVASEERLNYFNYFTEVEDEFVRRRGKHLLMSPIDWALVESWKDAGIPLTVVIRGISRAFDAFEARPKQFRKINSILYCEQAVEETYAEHKLARVGGDAAEEGDDQQDVGSKSKKRSRTQASSFTSEALLDFIERVQAQLTDTSRWLGERDAASADPMPAVSPDEAVSAIDRARGRLAEISQSIPSAGAIDAEAIELDLCALDNMLFEQLKLACGTEIMKSLRTEAETQLKGYRGKMDQAMYELTLDNFVGKRLRGMCHIPRLSLFYM